MPSLFADEKTELASQASSGEQHERRSAARLVSGRAHGARQSILFAEDPTRSRHLAHDQRLFFKRDPISVGDVEDV